VNIHPKKPKPTDDTFVEDLLTLEADYRATRSLYERVLRDKGYLGLEATTVLLDEIEKVGKDLRYCIDDSIADWISRW